jgi:hypothetical protein
VRDQGLAVLEVPMFRSLFSLVALALSALLAAGPAAAQAP